MIHNVACIQYYFAGGASPRYLSVMLKNSNKTSTVCDTMRTLPHDSEMALNLTPSRTYVI